MKDNQNSIHRRGLLRFAVLAGCALGGLTLTAAYAAADPVELRYFYRAPWP